MKESDIYKFLIALGDFHEDSEMITAGYVKEKLNAIIKERASWHPCVEAAYKIWDEDISSEKSIGDVAYEMSKNARAED